MGYCSVPKPFKRVLEKLIGHICKVHDAAYEIAENLIEKAQLWDAIDYRHDSDIRFCIQVFYLPSYWSGKFDKKYLLALYLISWAGSVFGYTVFQINNLRKIIWVLIRGAVNGFKPKDTKS